MADEDNAPVDVPADNPTPDNPAETGGVTPEEVAQVLQGSGMDVKPSAPVETDEDEQEDDEETPQDEPAPVDGLDKPPVAPEAPKADVKPADKPEAVTEEPKAFTMEVVDANGVTYKLDAADNIEEALADFEPKNNGQIMAVLDQFRDLKEQKAAEDVRQAEATEQAVHDEKIAKIQESWDGEITNLQASERMPKAGDELEARKSAIYAHMGEQNAQRIKDGRPTISSFEDALNSLEIKENKEQAETKKNAAKEQSRKNGALVGGSSAPASSGQPAYQANSGARTADQALKRMGLL